MDPKIGRARLGASAHYLLDGMGFGIWAALIPTLKARLELSDLELSQVLLAMVFGALASMTQVGRTLSRWGSHRVLAVLGPAYSMALLIPLLAPGLPSLMLAAFVFGGMKGALDVSVNTQAMSVEGVLKRPINSSFQALWSAGGLLASLATGAALKAQIPVWQFTGLLSLLLAGTSLATAPWLWPDAEPSTEASARRRFPGAKVLMVGLLAFFALFSEGVMMDWGAVYSQTVGQAADWLAPIAFGVFSAAMASARLVGDALLERFGTRTMLRFSGFAMSAGLGVMILLRHWQATFVGLGLAGLGMANLVPILLRAGGRAHPDGVSHGLATVSMIGYVGFLAGPPAIGALSEVVGLPAAFSLVAGAALMIGGLGPKIVEPGKT